MRFPLCSCLLFLHVCSFVHQGWSDSFYLLKTCRHSVWNWHNAAREKSKGGVEGLCKTNPTLLSVFIASSGSGLQQVIQRFHNAFFFELFVIHSTIVFVFFPSVSLFQSKFGLKFFKHLQTRMPNHVDSKCVHLAKILMSCQVADLQWRAFQSWWWSR